MSAAQGKRMAPFGLRFALCLPILLIFWSPGWAGGPGTPQEPLCGGGRGGNRPVARIVPPTPDFRSCGLGWAFDDTVDPPYRIYIRRFLDDVSLPLLRVMGPPSDSITVLISYDPSFYAGGNFYNDTNTLLMKYMPAPPDTGKFNFLFLHEVIHSFQDASMDLGDLAVGWPAEGIAVCATELVKLQSFRDFTESYFGYWNLWKITPWYDAAGQMGGPALSGTTWLYKTVSNYFTYGVAGAFWWILSCSQIKAPEASWSDYTYLAKFNQKLYETCRPMSNQGIFTTIRETAPLQVDGLPAEAWARAQPITSTAAPSDRPLLWAMIPGGTQGLAYQPYFRVASDSLQRLYNLPIRVRIWRLVDPPSRPFADRQIIPYDNGWDFAYEVLPELIQGSYRVEVDASAYGAGKVYLITSKLPDDSDYFARDSGLVLSFYDPIAQRVLRPDFTLSGASIDYEYQGAFQVMPWNVVRNPSSFGIQFPSSGRPIHRIVPLPGRRFMRIDVPSLGTWQEKTGGATSPGIDLRIDGPNPKSCPAQVHFRMPEEVRTRLILFDVSGREVAKLYEGSPEANQELTVGLNSGELPSGLYLLRLQSEAGSLERRVLVLR